MRQDNSYGLGYRPQLDPFIRTCAERGVAFVPFFAIAGAGREEGAGDAHEDVVVSVARAHGASPAQIKLAWALRRGPNVLVIPGTGNPAHLAANVAAGSLHLSPDDLAALDQVHTGRPI